jgi:hypothetical protein
MPLDLASPPASNKRPRCPRSRLPCPLQGHVYAGPIQEPQYRHLPSHIASNGVRSPERESRPDEPGILLPIRSVPTSSEPRVQDESRFPPTTEPILIGLRAIYYNETLL